MLLQILRKYGQYSDEMLVEKYQVSGNNYYVGLLFERYNEMTVALALNYLKNETEAEDAVMDCFEILHEELKSTSIKNFGGWYYSVVRNHLLKVKRLKQRRYSEELIEGYHDKGEEDVDLKLLFDNKEENVRTLLDEVLSTLKPDQEKCIKAFYLEDASYVEIVDKYGYTENEVKSHIQNGRRKLKIELEKRNVKSFNEI